MDTVYPEPTSMLYRRPVRKKLRGNTARHRTQPVTFSEIQEVDEDNLEDIQEASKSTPKNKSDIDLNRKFDEFRKLCDKRYSKSEYDSPSPLASPEISPTKDPTAGKSHPLEVEEKSSNSRSPVDPIPVVKNMQRPSI